MRMRSFQAVIVAAAVCAANTVASEVEGSGDPLTSGADMQKLVARDLLQPRTPLPAHWRERARQRAGLMGLAPDAAERLLESMYPSRVDGGVTPSGDPVEVTTVGASPGCDVADPAGPNGLQAAIDAAATDANGTGLTEIRVARSGAYTDQRYIINDATANQAIRIVGGYDTCADSTPDGFTVLEVTGGLGPLFFIRDSGADPAQVTLENLIVRGPDNAAGEGLTGRGVVVDGRNDVELVNVQIEGHNRQFGAGLWVRGTGVANETEVFVANGTSIADNVALGDGGGIHCQDSGVIVIDWMTAINNNVAGADGGGIYADDCTIVSTSSLFGGLFLNQAEALGGGIHARNGAQITLDGGEGFGLGNANTPGTVDNNAANLGGGGIYATGAGTSVALANMHIRVNSGDADGNGAGSGGGIAVADGATLEMGRTLAPDVCHTRNRCSWVEGNVAHSGGAISATGDNVLVDIRQTWLEANEAVADGSAIAIDNTGGAAANAAELQMEGALLARNPTAQTAGGGEQSVIALQDNSVATVAHTTFADNLEAPQARALALFSDVDLSVYSSVFGESSGEIFEAIWGNDIVGLVNCAVVFENASLPPDSSGVVVADPGFQAPGAPVFDYHLNGGSPALDRCDTSAYTPQYTDVDLQNRGFDFPVADVAGPWDAGADERLDTRLLVDGFEAGSL